MAWLRRAAILCCAVSISTAVLTFGNPSPPEAKANVACEIGVAPVGSITGAVGIGNPAGDACNAITDPVLGVAGHVLDPLNEAAASLSNGVFDQITTWASDGAVWLLGEVAELTQKTTSPNLLSKGFVRQYRQMAQIAAVLALAMLIFAALEGLGRGDGSMLWRVFLVNVPVAAIATSAAYVVVQLLVATTDGFSEVIAHSTAADTREFFKSAVEALGETGVAGGVAASADSGAVAVPLFVGFIAAIVAAFAAFLVWVELLMRDAAIYAVALFMPLAVAASIWPRWMSALRRTGELVIVVVFSKFVIVSIIALAASLLANTGGKVEHVLAAGALLLLACFAPFVLFKLVPFAEGAVSSAYSRQSAGGASVRTVEFASSVQMMRRAALANWAAGNTGGGGSGGGGGGGAGGGPKGRSGGPGGGGSSGGGARGGAGEAAGANGGAAGVAALPIAAGAGAARGSKAAGERLAGTGTGQASAEAGGHSAGTGNAAGAESGSHTGSSASDGAEQRPARPGAADRASGGEQGSSSSSASSTTPEPTEARGGKAPGSGTKPPRPSGGTSAPSKGGVSPKGPAG
jgi:hypothetical protein